MLGKNRYIELLRFIFCIFILLHHSGFVSADGNGLLPSGGVIADAFFMLTGYFACVHLEKNTEKNEKPLIYSINYTFRKLVKVLPYTSFGILIIYFLELLQLGFKLSLRDCLQRIYYMISELLLLSMTGIIKTDLLNFRNAPLWYLSAILIALPCVMYISIKANQLFKRIIVWFAPLCIQMWMVERYGGALPWMDSFFIIKSGAVRGFSSLIMGFGIYYCSNFIRRKKDIFSKQFKIMLTIIEMLLLILLIYNMSTGVSRYYEIFTLYIIYFMLVLVLSGVTYTSKLDCKFFELLGKISLPIYCIHWGIYRWMAGYLGYINYWPAVIITLILCILTSSVLMYMTDSFRKRKYAK